MIFTPKLCCISSPADDSQGGIFRPVGVLTPAPVIIGKTSCFPMWQILERLFTRDKCFQFVIPYLIFCHAEETLAPYIPPSTPVVGGTFTIETCLQTIVVTSMPCCYGLYPEYNYFCMSKGASDCSLDRCVKRNDLCTVGQGTMLRCKGFGIWDGILDQWCFEHCLLTKSLVAGMCSCEIDYSFCVSGVRCTLW